MPERILIERAGQRRTVVLVQRGERDEVGLDQAPEVDSLSDGDRVVLVNAEGLVRLISAFRIAGSGSKAYTWFMS